MPGTRQARNWDELVPQIVEDLSKGKRLTTVAKQHGVSTERIRQVLKKYGHTVPAQRPLPLGKRPPKSVLIAREHSIIKDRTELGLSLEEIGAKHQITRERVRQILVAAGYEAHTEQAKVGKVARISREEEAMHDTLVSALLKNPSLTRAELARVCGAPVDDITRLLDTSAWMLSEDQTATANYDTDEMLSCIGRAARDLDTEELSGRMYDEWRRRHSTRQNLPSSQAITRRFGTWADAVLSAGLTPITPNRSNYRRVTWDEATEAVVKFIVWSRKQDPYTRATAAEYDEYARQMGITPSIAGIRLYWSWREVRVGAVKRIADKIRATQQARAQANLESEMKGSRKRPSGGKPAA